MTAMQDVKDTVGQDDRMRELSYEFFELFEGNNLFSKGEEEDADS